MLATPGCIDGGGEDSSLNGQPPGLQAVKLLKVSSSSWFARKRKFYSECSPDHITKPSSQLYYIGLVCTVGIEKSYSRLQP